MKFAPRSLRTAGLAFLVALIFPGLAVAHVSSDLTRTSTYVCSEVCSGGPAGGGVGASVSPTSASPPCSEVCSGGGYGAPGLKTPAQPTADGGPNWALLAIASGVGGLALLIAALAIPRRRARRAGAIAH
jgi:hypothetical protein